ncbi:MAG TPA: hypothetical protein VHM28_08395, partial [Anaerolineales bacterium]|nr:hypothetical protein [Anaerolineales bacterium]
MNVKRIVNMGLMLILSIGLIGITPVSAASPSQTSNAGATQTYLILYNAQSVPSDAATSIATAGGTLVYSYDAIGVAVARSSSDTFRTNLLTDPRIQGAQATTNFATQLSDDKAANDNSQDPTPPASPAPGDDNLSSLQWDMIQIHAPEAHAITGGDPS